MARHYNIDAGSDIMKHMQLVADHLNTDDKPSRQDTRWALREGAHEIERLRKAIRDTRALLDSSSVAMMEQSSRLLSQVVG